MAEINSALASVEAFYYSTSEREIPSMSGVNDSTGQLGVQRGLPHKCGLYSGEGSNMVLMVSLQE